MFRSLKRHCHDNQFCWLYRNISALATHLSSGGIRQMAQCMIRVVHVIRWAQAEVVHGRNETQAARG